MRRRALVTAAIATVVVVGAVVGVRALWSSLTGTSATGCRFGQYATDTGQASTAATMVGVVITRGLPERAAVLVLAAGLQESKLRNIPDGQGDRDSIGVLQQRPSQGWGKPAQLADVRYATGAFLDKLVKVRAWQTRPLATVVQAVQISADGSAYAPHEPEATAIADALSGHTPRALTCSFAKPAAPNSVAALAARLALELPVNPPTVSGPDISVTGAGWATAAWLVANADRGGLTRVSYNGWRWTPGHGWRAQKDATATMVVALQGA